MALLVAEGITAGYDGPPVLDNVQVTAESGKTTVVLGPNGAGKSTLAKAIMGLLRIRSGHVRLGDQDVTGLVPHKLVRRGLGYLPQLGNVFDDMSVQENLEMGGYTIKGDLRRRIDKVLELFPDLGVDRHKKADALSGGQQRMLALARLLMTEPVVAILDEPTAGLSPLYAERVWEQIDRIRSHGVGLFVVEQNASLAMDHADSVCLLAQGRNVLSGDAAELRERAEVARILVG
ncbi:MAG TPA: ABC transporter ATP-binding protein [Solirubrobacteraceae bacterium]|jgi:branched-chain amino acid transport system ATP-binding protein|nr:ABC transporter ATP-binding protein [Solirubrobacteraceae bacterium]